MVSNKKLQAIVQDVRDFCLANADDAVVKKYAKFFTEGYDAYGVNKDLMVQAKKEFPLKYKDQLSFEDAKKLGNKLLVSGKYEETSHAFFLIWAYKDQYDIETFQYFGEWLSNGIHNWGHTDVLCSETLSVFLERNIIVLDDMSDWRISESKWQRRAVPVTMITPLKSGNAVEPMLDFIEPMMLDDDRFVQQGLGWFLREAWKLHPNIIEAFLLKWKDTAPRKIYQYATEKMSKEQKARFKKGK